MNFKTGLSHTDFIEKVTKLDKMDCQFHVDIKLGGSLAKKMQALDFVVEEKTQEWLSEVLNIGINYIVQKKVNEMMLDKGHDCAKCDVQECPLREFFEKKDNA